MASRLRTSDWIFSEVSVTQSFVLTFTFVDPFDVYEATNAYRTLAREGPSNTAKFLWSITYHHPTAQQHPLTRKSSSQSLLLSLESFIHNPIPLHYHAITKVFVLCGNKGSAFRPGRRKTLKVDCLRNVNPLYGRPHTSVDLVHLGERGCTQSLSHGVAFHWRHCHFAITRH